MAKQFYTTGEGSQQTLTAADQSKVKVYDSKTDMDSDTSNIAEGEIVATKAGESEGVVEVVDEVTDGVMNPVTSNAVYQMINPSSTNGKFIIGKLCCVWGEKTNTSSSGFSIDFGVTFDKAPALAALPKQTDSVTLSIYSVTTTSALLDPAWGSVTKPVYTIRWMAIGILAD